MFRMNQPSTGSIKRIFTALAVILPVVSYGPLPSDPAALAGARRASLDAYYRAIIRPNTDLEAFARLAERAAQPGDLEIFLDDMSWLITGAPDSRAAILVAPIGRGLEQARVRLGLPAGYPNRLGFASTLRFGSSGFQVDDKSNQVQHFWFSVILSYHLGGGITDALARYHEWNAPGLLRLLPFSGNGDGDAGDLCLSRQAIWLGQALRDGKIQPAEVGDWLRNNL